MNVESIFLIIHHFNFFNSNTNFKYIVIFIQLVVLTNNLTMPYLMLVHNMYPKVGTERFNLI
jgi:hypothetical protein